MAQRQYLTIHRILIFAAICLTSLMTYAGINQPQPGSYNFYSSYNFIDQHSTKNRHLRSEYFIKTQNEIALQKERSKLIKNNACELNRNFLNSEIRELEEIERLISNLEQESNELAAFSDADAMYFDLEYGINSLESFGMKIGYKTDQFADSKSKNKTATIIGQDVSIYYKYKFYQNGNMVSLIQPRIHSSMYNKRTGNQYCDLSLLFGYTKQRKNYDFSYEMGISIRNYFSRNVRNNIGYVITTQEMIKTPGGFIISNFTEYEKAEFTNMLYRSTIYDQISIAKELSFDNLGMYNPTIQVGYFWKGSLMNRFYTVSGPIISLWFIL